MERNANADVEAAADKGESQRLAGPGGNLNAQPAKDALARFEDYVRVFDDLLDGPPLAAEAVPIGAVLSGVAAEPAVVRPRGSRSGGIERRRPPRLAPRLRTQKWNLTSRSTGKAPARPFFRSARRTVFPGSGRRKASHRSMRPLHVHPPRYGRPCPWPMALPAAKTPERFVSYVSLSTRIP